MKFRMLAAVLLIQFAVFTVYSQTTEFTYQGSLKDGASPANGNYDFEFRLYDAAAGGNQIGLTIVSRNNVAVTAGIFSVAIDFGVAPPIFPGADRYLDIRVRSAGGGAFTLLAPRGRVSSSPYTIQSLNAATATNATTSTNALQLGGVAANQYVVTTDPRMTDARPPTAGSTNYIQNTAELQQFAGFDIGGIARVRGDLTVDGVFTANLPPNNPNYIQNRSSQQSLSNFNISGTGTANIINATTQYNIDGNRVLRATSSSTFLGRDTGSAITTGFENSFFGSNAGRDNTTGNRNAFFGQIAGVNNETGNRNSFFGADAGALNTTGEYNSFFGSQAGLVNTTGSNNTIIGTFADVASDNLTYATAIGSGAVVTSSNRVQIGRADLDAVRIGLLAAPSATQLCIITATNTFSACSSSARYKENIKPFFSGLNIVKRLNPITYDWIESKETDLGLIAEDVEKVEPLLVTYNHKGETQGVKYDQISVVLINAIKEQQDKIETLENNNAQQEKRNEDLKKQVDALKAVVCSLKSDSAICKS